jgi:hypothetical protein
VRGDICTICCGTEREVTVSCPLDCPYLADARIHDKPVPLDPEQVPNRDITLTEDFLENNEQLIVLVGQALASAAFDIQGAVDFDVREALESMIRTYRTLQSGVYYQSIPTNPLAASIYSAVEGAVEQFRREEHQRLGMSKTRDADVLGVFVFLQRIERDRNNGRRRGRAFLDAMRQFYPARPGSPAPDSSPLILP